jgi:hypothetical protein
MDRSEWVAWRRSLSEAEYASHIVSTSPRSIEGSGGSDVCFSVAIKLWENFDDRSVVEGAMRQYNAQSCDPAWSEAELQHKITTAAAKLGSAVGSKKWRGNGGGDGSKVAAHALGHDRPRATRAPNGGRACHRDSALPSVGGSCRKHGVKNGRGGRRCRLP